MIETANNWGPVCKAWTQYWIMYCGPFTVLDLLRLVNLLNAVLIIPLAIAHGFVLSRQGRSSGIILFWILVDVLAALCLFFVISITIISMSAINIG